ncbi:MAG: PAS domain S-box protein [Anaerolineae bacterium]|nr:PAS domain S-box protein [Anaerolineae bacterium]
MSEREKNARILFVAGGLPLLRGGARLLGDAGHQVIEAATGQEGLRLAQEWKPDLVLLGVMLPDLNGVEVCRRIKADPQLANTHVVILSATRAESDSPTEALEAGCDDYITWPVPNQELMAHVAALLRLKRTEQALQKLAYDLGERVKELNCLYGISQLIGRQGMQLQEILQGAVNLIPPAFQYPDAACARISLDGQEFRTQNYRETAWRQVADLLAHRQRVGVLEVCYLEEKPEADEGPFLVEEVKLVQTVAEHLSRAAERLWAEEALEASEVRYRRLFETAQDGILILDADTGQIADVNPFLVEMLGYSPEELRGKRLWEIGLFKDVTLSRSAFVELQSKGYIRYADLPLEASDGRRIDVEFVSNVYLVDHERVIQCNIRDITARKRVEEALQQRTAELEARNEELDAFAHTVAHDLQGLVGLVTGYAEVLAEDHTGFSDEELERCFSAVVHNGHKISEIIDGLLLLAGARKMAIKIEPLGMPSIVAEAQRRLASMIAEYEAEMVVPDTWPAALGYGPWVEEVWVNYISNAIQYGGRPPRVELGAEAQPDGMVRFWVQDNGSGLMPEARARLFIPFTQLAHLNGKGHGLGLSIVQRIVDRLGGQVGVESEGVPGRGSVFSFTLPGVDDQSQDGQSS